MLSSSLLILRSLKIFGVGTSFFYQFSKNWIANNYNTKYRFHVGRLPPVLFCGGSHLDRGMFIQGLQYRCRPTQLLPAHVAHSISFLGAWLGHASPLPFWTWRHGVMCPEPTCSYEVFATLVGGAVLVCGLSWFVFSSSLSSSSVSVSSELIYSAVRISLTGFLWSSGQPTGPTASRDAFLRASFCNDMEHDTY